MEIIRIIEQAEKLLEKQGADGSSLAKKLGFSPRYIADIKAGKSKNPGSEFILALINKLNFNPLWLETGEGDMFLPKYAFTLRIRELRQILSLEQSEFAKKMGISLSSLKDFEEGGAIPSDFVERLQRQFSVNKKWFLEGKGEPFGTPPLKNQSLITLNSEYSSHQRKFLAHEVTELKPFHIISTENEDKLHQKPLPIYQKSDIPEGAFVVPLLDQRLSAGSGSYLPEEDEITALIHVPAYLARYGKNIKALTVDGDSMYPTLSRGDIVVCDSCGWSGDGIYALHMNGSGLVKRLSKRPGKLVVISDNPKYQPYEEPEESQDIQIIGRVHCAIKQLE